MNKKILLTLTALLGVATGSDLSVPQWSATFQTNAGPITRTPEGRSRCFNMINAGGVNLGGNINGINFNPPLVLTSTMTQTDYAAAILRANLKIFRIELNLTPEQHAQKDFVMWLASMDATNRNAELAKHGSERINYINWLAGMSAEARVAQLGYSVNFN
jgi:hypothetical protein